MIILKAVFYIGLFFFCYDRLTYKYKNNAKLVLFIGKKGSGKTTNLTKIALKHIKKGIPVYSTVDIPGTYYFNPEWLNKGMTIPEGSCLLIDEVGMIWDNRQFKSFSTNTRDFFKLQRHARIKCYMFSQTTDVDKKLRDLCDEIWLCKSFARVFSVQRMIIKKIGVSTDEEGNGQLVDCYKFAGLIGGLKFTFIPRYVEFFNSHELPKKPEPKPVAVPISSYQLALLHNRFWMKMEIRKKYRALSGFVTSKVSLIIERARFFARKKIFRANSASGSAAGRSTRFGHKARSLVKFKKKNS